MTFGMKSAFMSSSPLWLVMIGHSSDQLAVGTAMSHPHESTRDGRS